MIVLIRLILTFSMLTGSWLSDAIPTAEDLRTELETRIRHHLKRGHEDRTLEWLDLAATHFDGERDLTRALCVISYESGGDIDANRTKPHRSAKSIFQHLDRYWSTRSRNAGIPGASIWDAEAQFTVAAWLVYETSSSWNHWTVYRDNCRHS